MNERDDELQKLLRRWETPQPGPQLDARVWKAFRQSRPSRTRKWLPLAAGILLAAGSATFWMARPKSVSIEATTDATGFRPLANGAIEVIKGGEKQ